MSSDEDKFFDTNFFVAKGSCFTIEVKPTSVMMKFKSIPGGKHKPIMSYEYRFLFHVDEFVQFASYLEEKRRELDQVRR